MKNSLPWRSVLQRPAALARRRRRTYVTARPGQSACRSRESVSNHFGEDGIVPGNNIMAEECTREREKMAIFVDVSVSVVLG
jgi:hypothetical protein